MEQVNQEQLSPVDSEKLNYTEGNFVQTINRVVKWLEYLTKSSNLPSHQQSFNPHRTNVLFICDDVAGFDTF